MLTSLLVLALPALLSALPAAPQFAPNAAADALTLKQIATEKRLIKTRPDAPAQWMTDAQIRQLYQSKTHFVDVTYTPEYKRTPGLVRDKVFSYPAKPTQQSTVNAIIAKANTDLMKTTLTTLSNFNNRYYRASTGEQSANWLFGQVKQVVADSKTKLNVTVTQFKHSRWNQQSIIARIEGKNGNQETIVVGAHQDSINGGNPMSGRAPGADDDGSGSVTILETLRVLLASDFAPTRPVEFQWYSGEEAGLLGSRDIAQSYKNKNRQVAAMLQFDMTMYPNKQKPDVGILTDNVSTPLTAFLRTLVSTYTKLPQGDFECGYGCSDHASWDEFGFPSSLAFESSNMDENTMIHTPQDALSTVDYDHGLNFVKIAVGFVVELAK